jgi:MSHA biogenesis protein MshI
MQMFARSRAKKGVVGIELRDDAIAFAHVITLGGKPSPARFEYCPTSADTAASVLSDLVQRHKLKGAACVGVIPQGAYQLLQVEPPAVPEAEQRQAVKWRLRERIDYPVADAVVDVFAPPQRANRPASNLNAVVCPADVVARCADTIGEAGLRLQALDIAELVQRNVLAAMPDSEAAVALLTFQAHRGLITLIKDAELYLARDLGSGLEGIRDAGLAGERGAPLYESVVLELQRSLDYFESAFGMAAIKRVLVYPSAEGVEQLLAHMRTMLPGLNTEIFDPAAAFAGTEMIPQGCLNAFGAALRDLEAAA